jgi:hypothetical protein
MITAARSSTSALARRAPSSSLPSRKSGAEHLAARTLCTGRPALAFYYNKKDFVAASTDDFVKDWKYNNGGVNHPLWWKLWVGGAATLFFYEQLYEYTRPVSIMYPPNYGNSANAATEAEDEEEGEEEGAEEEAAEEGDAAADDAPAPADDGDGPADDAPKDDDAPAAPADEDPSDADAPQGGDAPAEDPKAED